MKTLPRFLTPRLLEALKVNPVTFLNGARQTGKSTLVQQNLDQIGTTEAPAVYVSFDRPTQMAAAANSPETFLRSVPGNLVIDEVQLVPEIFRSLKVVVDDLRLENKSNVNGKFLLTGSANILALPKLSDPLVGRMSVMTLYPFSSAEATRGQGNGLERIINMDFSHMSDRGVKLGDAIKLATFPEIAGKEEKERRIWFDGYLTTILQRDVKMIADLEKAALLPGLLRMLASRTANLINDSDISRDLALNSVTTKTYRNILKMMFLNFDLEPWYRNIGKRLVKSPKGYLLDTLMACHMLDLSIDEVQRSRPELFGHLLENFVATELVKLLSFSEIRAQLSHFRTSDGKEVDFILERPDGSLFAIEIKKAEAVNMGDFKGIKTFAELNAKDFKGGVVLYFGNEVVPFEKNLWAVPLHILWQ